MSIAKRKHMKKRIKRIVNNNLMKSVPQPLSKRVRKQARACHLRTDRMFFQTDRPNTQ